MPDPDGQPADSHEPAAAGPTDALRSEPTGEPPRTGEASPKIAAPKPRIDAAPLLELAHDTCLKCGAPMDHSAVVCMKCGFDHRTGEIAGTLPAHASTAHPMIPRPMAGAPRELQRGREPSDFDEAHLDGDDTPSDPLAPTPKPDFTDGGPANVQALLIAGISLTVLAMVTAGAFAPRGAGGPSVGVVLASAALALYNALLHTLTGAVAVWIAAHLMGRRLLRIDLTLARMFVCVGVLLMIAAVRVPLGVAVITNTVPVLLGAGAYFLLLMMLFKKDRHAAGMVLAAHFALWFLVQAGIWLAGWLQAAVARMGTAGAGIAG